MAVSLVGLGLLLAGSAASAQQVNRPASATNWPPFNPAVPDRPAPPSQATFPTVILLPEHPTPAPAQPAGVGLPAAPTPSAVPAGGWQPTLPKETGLSSALMSSDQAASSVAMAPMAPAPGMQTRPRGELRGNPLIRQTRLQGMDLRGADESLDYQIQLEVPGPDRVFRRESELHLQMRIQQEARGRSNLERITFPEEPPISTDPYTPRAYPPTTEVVEPFYVCYGRLYFEEKNSERYGWDLGFVQPFVSATCFFWDAATLPYHIGTNPFRHWECNTGYCLPGDPVPYLLYPPEISVTGGILEAGTIVALFAIFPG